MPTRQTLKLRHWRKILLFQSMRLGMAASARLLPDTTARWAMRIFATPYGPRRIRYDHAQYPAFTEQRLPLRSTRRFHHIQTYIWGNPQQQPTVLLVHGWSGWGLQLVPFVQPLLDRGYSVVAVDMPAHGHSTGYQAHFFSWLDALRLMRQQFPRLQAIIGHSLGGATLGYALSQGLHIPQAVMIAAPADLLAELHRFSQQLWLPQGFGERIAQAWNRRLAKIVHEVKPEAGQIPATVKGLLVHDQDDLVVSIADMYRYQRVWPGAEVLCTSGLGHTRLLKDPHTIQQIVDWLGAAPQ
jgi:pimeloyl-ACP methyl ester carboxylesterase